MIQLLISNRNMSTWEVGFFVEDEVGPCISLSLHAVREDGEQLRDVAGWQGPDDLDAVVRIILADTPEHDPVLLRQNLQVAKEAAARLLPLN